MEIIVTRTKKIADSIYDLHSFNQCFCFIQRTFKEYKYENIWLKAPFDVDIHISSIQSWYFYLLPLVVYLIFEKF